ncbi:hypothetical protein [Nocardioides sambongensis]|uniref:hypothetical protein n=1 Tax=Nocardioides sambongensis TaxID=2589074 RepID=UPI00112EA530|nr:hypothetical protein [Nocardioides sambongensis]
MKKIIVGLLAAALMALGLVGVTGGTATACADNYTGCVNVKNPKIQDKKRKKGAQVKIKADFAPKSGDADVYGAVTLTCTNGKATKSKTKGYAGKTNITLFNFNKKGVWNCKLSFYGANAQDKARTFKVRVRK